MNHRKTRMITLQHYKLREAKISGKQILKNFEWLHRKYYKYNIRAKITLCHTDCLIMTIELLRFLKGSLQLME